MNANRAVTTIDADPDEFSVGHNHHHVIAAGTERIQDLVRQATLAVEHVLAEVRETIAKTEAELEVSEKISVVLERDRTVMSVERNFRFAKDK